MKRKISFILVVLLIGTLTTIHAQTRITVENRSGESVYLQPEDTIGFNKLGDGVTVVNMQLKEPRYYKFIGKQSAYLTLFVQPGNVMKIVYDGSSLKFIGDNADINTFLQKNNYICPTPEGVTAYSPEWIRHNESLLKGLYDQLDHSGFSPEFIAIHKQYLYFIYLNQRLNGPQMLKVFGHDDNIKLADDYYDFLKDLKFEDENIIYLPKWFTVINAAFEEMEKQGFIPVSNAHYMKNYASKITNEKLRSYYLIELLNLTLKKGYSDDFMSYLEDVKSLITDETALTKLPGLIELYNKARENNKSILRGMPMPDFTANTVAGKDYKLSDFKGKILVLDFWFTGCIPCKAEMPFFDKLAEEFQGQSVQFISISLDMGDQLMSLWKKMMAEKDDKGPVLNVNLPGGFKSEFAAKMNIRSVPRIVLVDKEGNIVDAYAKRPSDPKLKQQIENLLGAEERAALNGYIQKIVQAKGSYEKEKVLNEFIREKGKDPKAAVTLGMMYFYYAQSLSTEGRNEDLIATINKITYEPLKRDLFYVSAVTSKENKDIATAEILARQAVELTEKINGGNKPEGDELEKYPQIFSFYGTVLIDMNKVKEAIPYVLKAYETAKTPFPDLKLNYLTILIEQQKYAEAKPFLEDLIRDGMSNEKYENWLEKVYKAEKGSSKGYKEYLNSLKKVYEDTLKKQVTQGQLNEVAPLFTLKNAKGENVSLADLKGKIVLLDFWATWCGPCKMSFPAMQKVVNKYKKDKDVVLLFIDTWEKDQAAAAEFLKKNNYDFELLYDTEKSDTAKDYKLKGIPAKIIIDKNGIIRYSLKGFSGSDEKNMMEVSAMIESLK